nr:MAG TPA: hypothetical protein [Caudoviricetes sp.]
MSRRCFLLCVACSANKFEIDCLVSKISLAEADFSRASSNTSAPD